MAQQIQLKGDFRHEENIGSGVITPGMLLEVATNTDGDMLVKAHATEGGQFERLFAVEDALQGKTVADNYADGDLVSYHVAQPGAEVMALVNGGVGLSNVQLGEQLISHGDGTLCPIGDLNTTTLDDFVVAIAMETVDLSQTADVDTLVRVRVL